MARPCCSPGSDSVVAILAVGLSVAGYGYLVMNAAISFGNVSRQAVVAVSSLVVTGIFLVIAVDQSDVLWLAWGWTAKVAIDSLLNQLILWRARGSSNGLRLVTLSQVFGAVTLVIALLVT